jgi:hypothetical protein
MLIDFPSALVVVDYSLIGGTATFRLDFLLAVLGIPYQEKRDIEYRVHIYIYM